MAEWRGFFAVGITHFFTTLIRATIATLAPTLSAKLGLHAHDLGLLGSGYFFGLQTPLGTWLGRHGTRTVLLVLLTLAVTGCVEFAWANGLSGLRLARELCGAGVSACLMGALTRYHNGFDTHDQLRAHAWMLMVGSVGMLCATLPVQWLVPWGALTSHIAMASLVLQGSATPSGSQVILTLCSQWTFGILGRCFLLSWLFFVLCAPHDRQ